MLHQSSGGVSSPFPFDFRLSTPSYDTLCEWEFCGGFHAGWGKQDHMTHIVTGNTAPGFSLKALDNKEYSPQQPAGNAARSSLHSSRCPAPLPIHIPFPSNASTNVMAAMA